MPQIRLFEVQPFAEGGLVRAAEKIRKGGRGNDDVLVHMTAEEFWGLEQMWGKADINPNTGLPEYGFLSKAWKNIKKAAKRGLKAPFTNPLKSLKASWADPVVRTVAPMVMNAFFPGAGTALGSALGLSGNAASLAGNAIIQGGIGAASGGKEGAIQGALGSVVGGLAGSYGTKVGEVAGLSGTTAKLAGQAAIKGAGAEATGGDFVTGALESIAGAGAESLQDQFVGDIRRSMGMDSGPTILGELGEEVAAPAMSPTSDRPVTTGEILSGADGSRVDRTASPITTSVNQPGSLSLIDLAKKYAIPALQTVAAFQGMGGGDDAKRPKLPSEFTDSLPVYKMNRQFRGLDDPSDYYTYGQAGAPQSGQHLFMAPEPFAGEEGTPTAPGGLEGAAGGPQQPVAIPPGRAGLTQRRQLEAQGWTFDATANMMYPPDPNAIMSSVGTQSFAARGGYQRGGEFDYWEQNEDVLNTSPEVNREGGHQVSGPGSGRSDDIEARLSDGEYVIDAESVALLGDGSGNEGARRLDEMRTNLRKHKAENLKKGEFSHKAKQPDKYMGSMRKLRRKANYEHGGLQNVATGGTI